MLLTLDECLEPSIAIMSFSIIRSKTWIRTVFADHVPIPERTQESDDIFPAEHALNLPIRHHGKLVDSITVDLFQGRP